MGKEELEELRAIRKLLMLDLCKSGVSTKEIGKTIGITARRVRQILPAQKIKKRK